MAKFIIVTKESDDYKTAINTDEIISILFFEIENQLREEK